MAGIVAHRSEVNLKESDQSTVNPTHPKACLMYYLHTVHALLDLSGLDGIEKLTDFAHYARLSAAETRELLAMCLLLSPEKLIGKCIFENAAMCPKNSGNTFYEIEAVSSTLAVTESMVIGGQARVVKSIMTYKRQWLQESYYEPLKAVTSEQITGPQQVNVIIESRPTATPTYSYVSQPYVSQHGCCYKCCCGILRSKCGRIVIVCVVIAIIGLIILPLLEA